MSNVVKSTIKKSRSRLLSEVTDSLNALSKKIDSINNKSDENRKDISNQISSTAAVLQSQYKNSGIVRISETEMITKIFSGLKMYVDPRDMSFAPHIALDSIWESSITDAWLAILKPHDVVLDIGANFGYFGALAAQNTDKDKAKIVLFEPNPKLIPYINKTLSLNWLKEQTTVENLAVSNKEGTATLSVLKDHVGSSSLHSKEHIDSYMHNKMEVEPEDVISVKTTSIDKYCKQKKLVHVNLIKMDIEGYEDVAYEGMRETIANSPNVSMLIEFTKESYNNPEKFYNTMLNDFGNVYVVYGDQIIKPKKTDYKNMIESSDDWVMPIFSKNSSLEQKINVH